MGIGRWRLVEPVLTRAFLGQAGVWLIGWLVCACRLYSPYSPYGDGKQSLYKELNADEIARAKTNFQEVRIVIIVHHHHHELQQHLAFRIYLERSVLLSSGGWGTWLQEPITPPIDGARPSPVLMLVVCLVVALQSEKRVTRVADYIAGKKWTEITSELQRQMYETRTAMNKLAANKPVSGGGRSLWDP
jgi:hypothetical protein